MSETARREKKSGIILVFVGSTKQSGFQARVPRLVQDIATQMCNKIEQVTLASHIYQ